jgi:hypothetical protein
MMSDPVSTELISVVSGVVLCDETTASCWCNAAAQHDGPHTCECGGSWHIDAHGEFHIDALPRIPPIGDYLSSFRFDPRVYWPAGEFGLRGSLLAAMADFHDIPFLPAPRICYRHDDGVTWIHRQPHTCPTYLRGRR